MEISLYGYAGTGKTTLAAALVGKRIEGFDPRQPVETTVHMRDTRLHAIAAVVKPARTTAPEFTLLDFKGAPRQSGFEEYVMSRAATSDGIVVVADAFSTDNPAADLQSLCLECIFRDADRLEKLVERRTAEEGGGRSFNPAEETTLARAREHLDSERFLTDMEVSPAEKTFLGSLGLITTRPFLIVVNGAAIPPGITSYAADLGLPVVGIDLAFPPSEELLAEFWVTLLKALGMLVFYTVGEKETRGWAVPAGTTAVEGAGKIHSDLARGFVRAEVIAYDDFIESGCSHTACRNRGTMRLEMKEYVLQDGDIINIRFTR